MRNNKLYIGFILVTMAVTIVGCSSNPIRLKSDTITIEYGEKLPDMKEYLKTDSMDKTILDKTTCDSGSIKLDEGKEYPSLGEYTVTYKYEDSTKEMKVKVQDTTKPVFEAPKTSLETYKDVKLDFAKEFKATDLSEVTITADDSQVDYSKEGEYKASVIATDQSGNTETVEVTVKVKKPTIKLDKTSKSMYVKESFILKADIKGKDDKTTFKSSNTSVATVDENGKVTAKKAGTITITATANGVDAICKVTVKNAPSGSTATTKKDSSGKPVTVVEGSGGGSSSSNQATVKLSIDVFNKINAERAKAGLPTLSWNHGLDDYAKTRAQEIDIKFSHFRPNGGTGTQGIPVDSSCGSEILAQTSSATSAVNGWMNSTGHRAAILNANYTSCSCSQYGRNWVVLFVG